MKLLQDILGGLAGAVALNIIHETAKHFIPDAPRIDLVGEEALSKTIQATGHQPPDEDGLYTATLAGDIISNTAWYTLIGRGNDKHLLLRGAAYGLVAGFGALQLTGPLGLDDEPVTKTTKTKVMTVGWYLVGGLVAATVMRSLRRQ